MKLLRYDVVLKIFAFKPKPIDSYIPISSRHCAHFVVIAVNQREQNAERDWSGSPQRTDIAASAVFCDPHIVPRDRPPKHALRSSLWLLKIV